MIASLIELGHNLGLKICAEGVGRTAPHSTCSRRLGATGCQGYFISRAIPASEVADFAARWNQENGRSLRNRGSGRGLAAIREGFSTAETVCYDETFAPRGLSLRA
jgi:predicted signal transduction protein with EAL and GGDEF domain